MYSYAAVYTYVYHHAGLNLCAVGDSVVLQFRRATCAAGQY